MIVTVGLINPIQNGVFNHGLIPKMSKDSIYIESSNKRIR